MQAPDIKKGPRSRERGPERRRALGGGSAADRMRSGDQKIGSTEIAERAARLTPVAR